ncbi:MAG TPA: M15 family metallopeptidase [Pyrinomonadaceae bacterium]
MKRTTLATTLVMVLVGYGSIPRVNSPTSFASAQSVGRPHQSKPASAPARWRGLIGEYGPDDNIVIILEKDGLLHVLFKSQRMLLPLKEVDKNTFTLPGSGERLAFTRNALGRATETTVNRLNLKRRNIEPDSGNQLRIKPVRPVPELMKEALAAQPPQETGDFLNTDLVELRKLDSTIRREIRYATTNNFLGTKFYTQARAFMQRPAAEALVRAHRKLKRQGYGLLIHDAYRPWYVTKVFWDATPEDKKWFVADPSKGSRHNRGSAVDLTLYHLKTGRPVEMVATYDETTDRAHSDYPGGTSLQRWHRELLRKAMEAEGFTIYAPEWWHFDYKDWQKYGIGNVRYEEIGRQTP